MLVLHFLVFVLRHYICALNSLSAAIRLRDAPSLLIFRQYLTNFLVQSSFDQLYRHCSWHWPFPFLLEFPNFRTYCCKVHRRTQSGLGGSNPPPRIKSSKKLVCVFAKYTLQALIRLRNDLYCVGWALNSTHPHPPSLALMFIKSKLLYRETLEIVR